VSKLPLPVKSDVPSGDHERSLRWLPGVVVSARLNVRGASAPLARLRTKTLGAPAGSAMKAARSPCGDSARLRGISMGEPGSAEIVPDRSTHTSVDSGFGGSATRSEPSAAALNPTAPL